MQLIVLLFCLLLPQSLFAAAINHTFVEVTSAQTTTGTSYSDIPGAVIPSAFFSAGKKYLILVTAQQTNDSDGTRTSLALFHGADSYPSYSDDLQHRSGAGDYSVFADMQVWTAVGGEDVKLRFATQGGGTARVNNVTMFAMNLSDDLTENTDWFFNEATADSALSTTPLNGGSVTFTPGSPGNWLVLSYVAADYGSQNTASVVSQLVRSGEASSSTPEWREEPWNTAGHKAGVVMGRVFSLGTSSNTFTEKTSMSSGTAGTRWHSSVFALNLAKFRNSSFAYTDAAVNLGTTNYGTNAQTLSITPDVSGDVWIGGYYGHDKGLASNLARFRLQVAGSDQPSGQTSGALQLFHGNDNTDVLPMSIHTVESLSSASTINLDASTNSTTGTPAAVHRSLWAVTMELAGGTAPVRKRRPIIMQ